MNQTLVFDRENGADKTGECSRSVTPAWLYMLVFMLVTGGTVTGFVAALLPLGPASLAVAILTSAGQAGLVVGFMMHLYTQNTFFSVLLVCAVLAAGSLWGLGAMNLCESGALNDEAGVNWMRTVERNASSAAAKLESQP